MHRQDSSFFIFVAGVNGFTVNAVPVCLSEDSFKKLFISGVSNKYCPLCSSCFVNGSVRIDYQEQQQLHFMRANKGLGGERENREKHIYSVYFFICTSIVLTNFTYISALVYYISIDLLALCSFF